MAPRAQWKGYLKLSLVSCPIALYPAIAASESISFRQVNRVTGNRLRQQMIDSVTGEVVKSHNKGRGYEVGKNQFLMVQNEELEAAHNEASTRPFNAAPSRLRPEPKAEPPETRNAAPKLAETTKQEDAPPTVPPLAPPPRPIIENTRTIELDRFVPREQIDPRYYNTPYYIAPRDQIGLEAFAVIRDAMAGKRLVGMGRIVLANRERPIIIEPLGMGLRGTTLRYAHEVRSEAEYFSEIPPMELPDEMVRITEHILETKREDFDPAYLEDRYRTVLVEKLREKQAQMTRRSVASVPSQQNVINLMDALRRSIEAEQPARANVKKPPAPSRTARATPRGRKTL
jgi:non-homologous end joining protein Ku